MKKEKLEMNINHIIANELSVKLWQVDAAIKLIDEGNTIPFIARYRKPVTGELNDEQLRTLDERLKIFNFYFFMESCIRFLSLSTLRTLTSTTSPTETTSNGCFINLLLISDMCTSPS